MSDAARDMVADLLFQPVRLGDLTLANRIVMAPMTRHRAAQRIPDAMTATYYSQRASAGLLISESTAISSQGASWLASPGIYTARQVDAWRQVTDAVHERGGVIFCQLFHCGRCSSRPLHPHAPPVAPSPIPARGQIVPLPGDEPQPYTLPHALELMEIRDVVAQFRAAASNAVAAGFDGVELHAANGFLLDQFLRDGSNRRSDEYGGSIANRIRLLHECVAAVMEVLPPGRVGVHVSPVNGLNDMADSSPTELYVAVGAMLSALGTAYLHVVEGALGIAPVVGEVDLHRLRRSFDGAYIANNGYDAAKANAALLQGHADLVSFGRLYISNPDLVDRLRRAAPLASIDAGLATARDHRGYIDYPEWDGAAAISRSAGSPPGLRAPG